MSHCVLLRLPRKATPTKDHSNREPSSQSPAPKKPRPDAGVEGLTGRTGGAYIPPARLRAMQAKITDKSRYDTCE